MKSAAINKEEIRFLIECMATVTGYSESVIKSKSRKRVIVAARFIVMDHLRKTTPHSFEDIGQESFGKDHATVMHAARSVKNGIETKGKIIYPMFQAFNSLLEQVKTIDELIKWKKEKGEKFKEISPEKINLNQYQALFDKVISKILRSEENPPNERDFKLLNQILNF